MEQPIGLKKKVKRINLRRFNSLKMNVLTELKNKKQQIYKIAEKYKASQIKVFGSVARMEESLNSDIDLLVTFSKDSGLLDEVGLWQELSELFNRKIDLVGDDSLSPKLREYIEKDYVLL
jgi:uncharacterized protein